MKASLHVIENQKSGVRFYSLRNFTEIAFTRGIIKNKTARVAFGNVANFVTEDTKRVFLVFQNTKTNSMHGTNVFKT